MNYRRFGKTDWNVSEISLGTWQVGGTWGTGFNDTEADRIINDAIDRGINFIDTADVYESGMSEKAVGRVVGSRSEDIYVASKCGRQINPHNNEGYTVPVLRKYVEDSLQRLQMECLDLIQLHCPPMEVYYRPEIFGLFEDLQTEGKIKHLGVSVEKVEEALKAIEFENVVSVQIIYNMFRQRPNDIFFQNAKEKDVATIIRVPLASGLLTGKYSLNTQFNKGDHRFGNRNGAWFDRGETFAGVPYEKGLDVVDQIKAMFPNQDNLAPVALKWILMNPNITTIIPGASKLEQVNSNLSSMHLAPLSSDQMEKIQALYDKEIKKYVHQYW